MSGWDRFAKFSAHSLKQVFGGYIRHCSILFNLKVGNCVISWPFNKVPNILVAESLLSDFGYLKICRHASKYNLHTYTSKSAIKYSRWLSWLIIVMFQALHTW